MIHELIVRLGFLFLSGACAIAAKDEFDNTAVKEINNKDSL